MLVQSHWLLSPAGCMQALDEEFLIVWMSVPEVLTSFLMRLKMIRSRLAWIVGDISDSWYARSSAAETVLQCACFVAGGPSPSKELQVSGQGSVAHLFCSLYTGGRIPSR